MIRNPMISRSKGFTLIEVLVAIAIFALLSALAYGSLGQSVLVQEALGDRMERTRDIQRAMRIITRDFLQLAPRPVRSELGDRYNPSLSTAFESGFAVQLTRGGWMNPMTLPRGTQQRAAYRLEDEELIRYHWNVLDYTLSNEIISVRLLDEVQSVTFLFMQQNGEWIEQWPPGNDLADPSVLRLRPRAVQIVLSLYDEGEITRIVEVVP